jgi:hypothetical protein
MVEVESKTPEAAAQSLLEQRTNAENFLFRNGVDFGAVSEQPVWTSDASVAVWTVSSPLRPGAVGWWVVTGADVWTDYVSGLEAVDARGALRVLARHLMSVAGYTHGEPSPFSVDELRKSNDEIRRQAAVLLALADDNRLW